MLTKAWTGETLGPKYTKVLSTTCIAAGPARAGFLPGYRQEQGRSQDGTFSA